MQPTWYIMTLPPFIISVLTFDLIHITITFSDYFSYIYLLIEVGCYFNLLSLLDHKSHGNLDHVDHSLVSRT